MAEISRAFLGVKGVQCGCDGAAWGIGASGGGASDGGLELCEDEGMNATGPSECPIDFNGVEVW
jgi:hypothetical protein